MLWWIGAFLVPACLLAGWFLARRPIRLMLEDMDHEQARRLFRGRREWLEARYVTEIERIDPLAGRRWADADWHDDVQWARDRRSHHLMALIGVQFPAPPFADDEDPARFATAVFVFRKGRWRVEGRPLPAMLPHEVCLRNQRYVPLVVPPQRL